MLAICMHALILYTYCLTVGEIVNGYSAITTRLFLNWFEYSIASKI